MGIKYAVCLCLASTQRRAPCTINTRKRIIPERTSSALAANKADARPPRRAKAKRSVMIKSKMHLGAETSQLWSSPARVLPRPSRPQPSPHPALATTVLRSRGAATTVGHRRRPNTEQPPPPNPTPPFPSLRRWTSLAISSVPQENKETRKAAACFTHRAFSTPLLPFVPLLKYPHAERKSWRPRLVDLLPIPTVITPPDARLFFWQKHAQDNVPGITPPLPLFLPATILCRAPVTRCRA